MRFEIPEKYLKAIVVALIVLLAGPEILAASEMLALVELFGAANFILLYVYGFKFIAQRPAAAALKLIRRLEPIWLFVPSWRVTKQMPGMLMHAVPLHSLTLVSVLSMCGKITWHGIQLL
jgi:hypothetical protein